MKKIIALLFIISLLATVSYAVTNTTVPTANQLLGCTKVTDCIIPSECPDTKVSCAGNLCVYDSSTCDIYQIVNYIYTMKMVDVQPPMQKDINSVNNVTIVVAGSSDNILGYSFYSAQTQPLQKLFSDKCKVDKGSYLTPSQYLGCYNITVSWGVETPFSSFSMVNGEERYLLPNVKIKYDAVGKGVYYGTKDIRQKNPNCFPNVDDSYSCDQYIMVPTNFDYEYVKATDISNVFTITFIDILDSKIYKMPTKVVLNTYAKASIYIENKAFSIPSSNAGYKIQVTKGLRDIYLEAQAVPMDLAKGGVVYPITLPTDELGSYEVVVTPYITITNEQYYNQQHTLDYYVLQQKDYSGISCTISGCAIGTCQSDGSCLFEGNVTLDDCNIHPCAVGVSCMDHVCQAGPFSFINGTCPKSYSVVDNKCVKYIDISFWIFLGVFIILAVGITTFIIILKRR